MEADLLFAVLNPIALRKAKIAYNFGLSKCNRVNLNGFCLWNLILFESEFVSLSHVFEFVFQKKI